jgi:hypothetical protein
MQRILFFLVLSFLALPLIAQDEDGIRSSSELLLQVSSLPEAKLGFTERFYFPFLQGEGPLTVENNISLALTAELSPISLNGVVEAVWTPIAFFQLATGGRIGSGWNVNLFGSDIYGIGINHSGDNGNAEINGSAFDGLLWKAQIGGALQFDLAAIFPGDWNHIIARSYHEINHKGYSQAKTNESWYFEADDGENCNGFNYYGNFLIGYQMPVFIDMIGFLAEMDLYLYDTKGRESWGDDLIRWTFSSIFNFTITEQFGITLLAQFRTQRNFVQSDWQDLYYRNRTIDNSKPLHLEFYRAAVALTYKF